MARQHKVSKYVQMEAESSDEEINSELSSQDIEGFGMAEPDYRISGRNLYEEKLQDLEARYRDVSEEDYEDILERPSQSKLLPLPSDPILFLIRVKIGKEKYVAAKIAEVAKEIGDITAVLQKDGLKGYIYVEAYKKTAVDEALYNIKNVYKNRIGIISLSEMVDVMNCTKDYSVGDYARMKGGRYKGDLVQIVENFEDCCQIKAIPRINNKKKLFDPEEFRNDVTASNGGFYYQRDFYKDGFLIKSVLKRSLDFDVTPTFEELKDLAKQNIVHLNDQVIIERSDLHNFKGKIINVAGNICTVTDNKNTFDADIRDLRKYAEVGERYSYRGENGMVLKVEGGMAVLGIKDMTDEIEVPVADLDRPVVETKNQNRVRKQITRGRRDQMINKRIKVIAGENKGMIGIVKEVQRDRCRIQISATLEEVTTMKSDLRVLEPIYTYAQAATPGYKTPGKTPGYTTPGYKTPGYATPGYKTPGYMTPGYKTPAYSVPDESRTVESVKSIYIGIKVMVDGEEREVTNVVDDKLCAGNSTFTVDEIGKDIEPVIPQKKYESVFIYKGEFSGKIGTLVEINEDVGKVQLKEGNEVISLLMDDLTVRTNN